MEKLADLLKIKYYTISYDLRKENKETKMTTEVVRRVLAIILILNECLEARCYVETTVHFSSTKKISHWVSEIVNYLGDYICFVLEEVKTNDNNQPIMEIHYSEHYKTYKNILEKDYEIIFNDLKSMSEADLRKELATLLLTHK